MLWFHSTCGELVVQQQGRFSTQLSTEQTARLHWKGVVVTHQQAVDAEERFCGVSQEGRLVGHTVVHVHFVPLNAGKSSEKLHFCPWHYFVTANVSIKHSLYSLFDHNAKHKITISQRNANNANCDTSEHRPVVLTVKENNTQCRVRISRFTDVWKPDEWLFIMIQKCIIYLLFIHLNTLQLLLTSLLSCSTATEHQRCDTFSGWKRSVCVELWENVTLLLTQGKLKQFFYPIMVQVNLKKKK